MTRLGLGRWALCCLLGCTVAAGCGDDDGGDGDAAVEGDGGAMDAFVPDGSRFPDGAIACETDEECDDGVFCTRDLCDPTGGYCRNPVDTAICDDGVFCNGVEQCDPIRGCVPGPPEACNDSDVCTIDSCDEEEKICRHAARDFDGDGEVDWHCEDGSGELGTDCDDRDPTRGSTLAEICMDTVDNDCKGTVDEEECGRPMHDTCDDPLDVSAGGVFIVDNTGAAPDYSMTCGSSSYRDVVLELTLTEAKDVDITADGEGVTAVGLRTTCDDRDTEFDCESGFPGRVRVRALEAGTYFVLVSDSSVGEIVIDVELTDPTEPPTNETCTSPIDVSAGGSFTGSTVDVVDDVDTACGFGSAPDLVYSFTTTEEQNVRIGLLSTSGDTMNFSVRSTCDDDTTQLRCARGNPAGTTLHELPAGTYYIVVEGPSFREVDFQLDVDFLASSPAPAGDSCSNAIALDLDTETLGGLSDKQDDHDISCGFYYKDAVYSFTLTERRDVTVTVDGGGTFMYASIRSDCTDDTTQLRCTSGNPSRSRLRDLAAGTYYVIVESFRGTSFNITVETSAPTVPTAVSGNDTCASAHVIPAAGGLFTGDTTSLIDDYQTRAGCGSQARSNDATFELTLTESKRVVASTEGSSFDTVLHVHETSCATEGERYCDDDSGDGSTSLIDRTFTAGTWYFVVDGFGTSSTGAYMFEVMISDP